MSNQEPKPPIDAKYGGGRMLPGLAAEEDLAEAIAEPHKRRPSIPSILEDQELRTLAVELGFIWSALGRVKTDENGDPSYEMCKRAPLDAEARYLQMTNPVPLAMVIGLYSGMNPAVFWTDLGITMKYETGSMNLTEYKTLLQAYYLALRLVQSSSSAEKLLGEGVDLVISLQSYHKEPFEITVSAKAMGAIFQNAPRSLIMRPKCDFDPKLGHKVIAEFATDEVFFFHSAYLRGQISQGIWGIDDVAEIVRAQLSKGKSSGSR